MRAGTRLRYGLAWLLTLAITIWAFVDGGQDRDAWLAAAGEADDVARVIGGLALFTYGFGVLAAGFRGLAGRRARRQLARLTEHAPGAVGVGALLGAATQLTTAATAVAVGLVEARLLAIGSAVGVLVGAQLGASLLGALLPVGLAGDSLEIIAVGVVWMFLSSDRRAVAIGRAVLGLGLVLYGLRLLQTGVDPMLTDPALLPYVTYLRAEGVASILLCTLAGVVLGAVLQGSGPVYALVLGLAQVSGVLPLESLLAILAGTNLGAAIGAALVCGLPTRSAPALIRPQLAFGLAATGFALITAPLWISLADALVPGAGAPGDGKTIAVQHLSAHLAIAFAASQIVATALWTVLAVPRLAAWATRRRVARSARSSGPAAAPGAYQALRAAFGHHRRALDACLEVSTSGDRAGPDIGLGLRETRRAIEARFAEVAAATAVVDRLDRAVLGAMQLQRAVEHLVQVTEVGVECGLALTPDEQTRLAALHRLAVGSLDALIDALDHERDVDVEAARGREIEMNQLEAETRQAPAAPGPRYNESLAVRLSMTELIDAYEHVGNHLFRVAKALGEDDDELS